MALRNLIRIGRDRITHYEDISHCRRSDIRIRFSNQRKRDGAVMSQIQHDSPC